MHFATRLSRLLPGAITSAGLLCGSLAVLIASGSGSIELAAWLIVASACFDFADGFAARLVNHVSEFGKQLDSLADVISFGLAPAMILFRLMHKTLMQDMPAGTELTELSLSYWFWLALPFLVAVFSAIRLAKFNLDKDQVHSFKGLPTPANALLIASIGVGAERNAGNWMGWVTSEKWLLLILIVLSCLMLVSSLRMFSLKTGSHSVKEKVIRYSFLASAAALIAWMGLLGMGVAILLYIVLSVGLHVYNTWVAAGR